MINPKQSFQEGSSANKILLDGYKNEIAHMHCSGCTRKQIQDFLARNGIEASLQDVAWFLNSRLPALSLMPAVKKSAVKYTLYNK